MTQLAIEQLAGDAVVVSQDGHKRAFPFLQVPHELTRHAAIDFMLKHLPEGADQKNYVQYQIVCNCGMRDWFPEKWTLTQRNFVANLKPFVDDGEQFAMFYNTLETPWHRNLLSKLWGQINFQRKRERGMFEIVTNLARMGYDRPRDMGYVHRLQVWRSGYEQNMFWLPLFLRDAHYDGDFGNYHIYIRSLRPDMDFKDLSNCAQLIGHDYAPQYEYITYNKAWRHMSNQVQRWLYQGMKPKEVAKEYGWNLTHAQAHEWVTSGKYMEVGHWYTTKYYGPHKIANRKGNDGLPAFSHTNQYFADWCIAHWDKPCMTKVRHEHTPEGDTFEYRWRDLFFDLHYENYRWLNERGVFKMPPDKAMAIIIEDRKIEMLEEAKRNAILFPDPGIEGTEFIIRLVNGAQLADEGEYMDHCVGAYAGLCIQGMSAIYSVRTDDSLAGRSTLEIRKRKDQWLLVQHRAYDNDDPTEHHVQLVEAWCKQRKIAY